nr:MAG TPA: hypothetical protein [Caudoviricetes sp.]DAJ19745.1 MAG TPA: hypothetical protein [Siphoviridae sp. cthBp9]DAJ91172.1 MAG TPA: hypothetical protein [Caudoviricetes sp.]DAL24511.1 MAG TPA_asm: hypothetical protein [Caudoviricetes sp.]DAP01173.1 MAG TPA: hypothetical protein [Caudoviricetes sp.]
MHRILYKRVDLYRCLYYNTDMGSTEHCTI